MNNSGVVNSEAYSIEEYRERMNGYLDHLEEELGDDAVILIGSFVGNYSFNNETDAYPNSHRIRGNLGYAAELIDGESWDGEESSPLRRSFEDRRLNALAGTVVLPKEYVSEEALNGIENSGGVAAPVNPEEGEDAELAFDEEDLDGEQDGEEIEA